MAIFATKVAWMSSKWAILVKISQKLKYLSGILTDFQNRPCFSELVKMSPRSVMLWSNWWKLKYLSRISTDLHQTFRTRLIFWISRNESKECYTTIKSDENSNISAEFQQFQQKLKYLSGILTDLHQTFRTGLVFLSQSIWVQGVLCYDQTDENLNISAESWLIWQILPKKWLRLAPNGQFWSFCKFFHLFPQNEAQIDSEWPISHDSQLSPSFATKASHFWRNLKNFHPWGGVHQQMFSVFQLFQIISHQSGSKWPIMAILPPKCLDGSKWPIMANFVKGVLCYDQNW